MSFNPRYIYVASLLFVCVAMTAYVVGRLRGETVSGVPGDGTIISQCDATVITEEPLDNGSSQHLYCVYKLTYNREHRRKVAGWEIVSCEAGSNLKKPSCEVEP